MPNESDLTDFRVAATREEIALWKWASKQKHGQTFDQFILQAMNAAVSETARGNADRGKPIPQFVAEALDKKRGEIKTGSTH